jgi:hypothetical protein
MEVETSTLDAASSTASIADRERIAWSRRNSPVSGSKVIVNSSRVVPDGTNRQLTR